MNIRVGQGVDFHRVASDDRPLVLGGVHIEEGPGLEGHSDADVLTHALMDAVLGACGLPDIGVLFPNTDESLRGISSITLLKEVMSAVEGWEVVNVDLTLIAERPKVASYRQVIREKLAEILKVSSERVGLKATTAEGLGDLGAGKGMQAFAVALMRKV